MTVTCAFSLPCLEGFSPFANQTRIFVRSLQMMWRDSLSYWSVEKNKPKSLYRSVTIMTLTLGQAINLFPQSDVLSADVRSLIKGNETWAVKQPSEIGRLKVYELAMQLQEILPDNLDPQAMPIAIEILENLKKLQLIEVEPVAPVATSPQDIKVTVEAPKKTWEDKSWDQMRLTEMLTAVSAEPSLYPEAKPFIEQQPQVKKASVKSLRWIVPANPGINVEETVALLAHLAKDNTVAPRLWKGIRPTSIEAAIGMRSAALYCPFRDTLIEGPDEFGRDLGELSEETHLALIWAKQTNHAAWPKTIDVFETIEEIFQETLSRRYQIILEDYRAAKLNQEESTEGISRFKKPSNEAEQVASILADILNAGKSEPQVTRNPWQNQPSTRNESEWKQLVFANTAARRIATNSSLQRSFDSSVIRGGQVNGSARINFNNTILIEDLVVNGSGRYYGSIRVPQGVDITTNGTSDDSGLVWSTITWQEIAREMGIS